MCDCVCSCPTEGLEECATGEGAEGLCEGSTRAPQGAAYGHDAARCSPVAAGYEDEDIRHEARLTLSLTQFQPTIQH